MYRRMKFKNIYNTIINPDTGRAVSVYGKLGMKVIKKYMKVSNQSGGKKCKYEKHHVPFRLTQCSTNAWRQHKNDCWLDSILYALFLEPSLRRYSNKVINTLLNAPATKDYKISLGFALRSYLEGFNNDDFSNTLAIVCKDKLKNDIVDNIVQYLLTENIGAGLIFSALGDAGANLLRPHIMTPYGEANAGAGDARHIVQIFQNELSSDIQFEQYTGKACASWMRATTRKFLINVIKKMNSSTIIDKDVVVILTEHRCTKDDLSRIVNLQTFTNNTNIYKLVSYVIGNGFHYTAGSLCSDTQWYNYDNTGMSSVKGTNITKSTQSAWHNAKPFTTGVEQIILVYMKQPKLITTSDAMATNKHATTKKLVVAKKHVAALKD